MTVFYSMGFPMQVTPAAWLARLRRWDDFVQKPRYVQVAGDHRNRVGRGRVEALGQIQHLCRIDAEVLSALGRLHRAGLLSGAALAGVLGGPAASVAVIGFCGGVFTVAGYLVEGRPSRSVIPSLTNSTGLPVNGCAMTTGCSVGGTFFFCSSVMCTRRL